MTIQPLKIYDYSKPEDVTQYDLNVIRTKLNELIEAFNGHYHEQGVDVLGAVGLVGGQINTTPPILPLEEPKNND